LSEVAAAGPESDESAAGGFEFLVECVELLVDEGDLAGGGVNGETGGGEFEVAGVDALFEVEAEGAGDLVAAGFAGDASEGFA
jgi:hypothetical protein